MHRLTGAPIRVLYIHPEKQNFDRAKAKATYRYWASKNYPMVTNCCNPNVPKKSYNIPSGHTSSLLAFIDLKDPSGNVAHTLVKLRNPHGKDSSKFSGPWHDKSDLWTDDYRQQVGDVDGGTFFVEFEMFMDVMKHVKTVLLDKDLFANTFIE